jgi:DNA uptake protein ComE-like DNA-binding protein
MSKPQPGMSKAAIEDIIERKVTDILAARALDQPSLAPQSEISEEVQKRLDMLEKKIDGHEDGREQGLTFLLMAKQHAVRGEDASALRMYSLAQDFFPDNKKLGMKIEKLREKIQEKREEGRRKEVEPQLAKPIEVEPSKKKNRANQDDDDYQDEAICDENYESDGSSRHKAKINKQRCRLVRLSSVELGNEDVQTPRTQQLLNIINTRDVSQIRLLRGIGAKKAEAIIEALCAGEEDEDELRPVSSLRQLGQLRGVGAKTVENMRLGLQATVSE